MSEGVKVMLVEEMKVVNVAEEVSSMVSSASETIREMKRREW